MNFFESMDSAKIVNKLFAKPSGIELNIIARIKEFTGTDMIMLNKCSTSKKDVEALKSGNADDGILNHVADSMNHLFKMAISTIEFHLVDGKSFKAETEEELLYAFSNLSSAEATWLRSEIEKVNPALKGNGGLSQKKN